MWLKIHGVSIRLEKSEPWRRGRDSNPRYGLPYTPLAGERLRPLGHLSNCADYPSWHVLARAWTRKLVGNRRLRQFRSFSDMGRRVAARPCVALRRRGAAGFACDRVGASLKITGSCPRGSAAVRSGRRQWCDHAEKSFRNRPRLSRAPGGDRRRLLGHAEQ